MKIYLIRHAKTNANILKCFSGSADIDITEDGKREIEEYKSEGVYPELNGMKVYTSGMKRTEQTLKLIYGDIEFEKIREFQEMNFGVFEGIKFKDIENMPIFMEFKYDKSGNTFCPNGESINSFSQRVWRGMNKIIDRGEDAVIFCHGGTMTAVMQKLFYDEEKFYFGWTPKNGKGYLLNFENNIVKYTLL